MNKRSGKKNRWTALWLAALLVFFLLPSSVQAQDGTLRGLAALRPYLEDAEHAVLQVRRALVNREETIELGFISQEEDMSFVPELVKALMEEALAETASPVEGDYIRYQYGGYSVEYTQTRKWNSYEYQLAISPMYYTTPEQERKTDAKVAEILAYLDFPEDASEVEKVRGIFHYLLENISYDNAHLEDDDYYLRGTAYASLVNRTAVCQGYSVTLYRLLKEAGLSCRIITGQTAGQGTDLGHAWNIVRIGDVYYNLDVTWASSWGREAFFLECSESFADHVRDPEFDTAEFNARYPMAQADYAEE